MENKKVSRGYQQFHQAPEVETYSALELAQREAEGLEPVHYAEHRDQTGRSYYSNEPKYPALADQAARSQQRTNRRRTWIIIGISAILALAVGIGVGVGVGLSVGKNSSDSQKIKTPAASGSTSGSTSSRSSR